MIIPTSNPIANKRKLGETTQVLTRASAPTSAQLIEAAGALAQVFSDVLGTKCQLKLIVEPQK